jgi:hypothetical protein
MNVDTVLAELIDENTSVLILCKIKRRQYQLVRMYENPLVSFALTVDW